jgi:fused signal recognition particle receptor
MFGWFSKKDRKEKAQKDSNESPFQRLNERLAQTRDSFIQNMDAVFSGKKKIDQDLLDELEELLITADLGFTITNELIENARKLVNKNELHDPHILKSIIKENILKYLLAAEKKCEKNLPASGPLVIMVIGVNGVGKTTTIAKLSHKYMQDGKKVLLVAADTFRAAATEQLKAWGERIGVEVSGSGKNTDPSSVVYDALEYSATRAFDVIIIDTAGRLHTKVNLMEELKKIKRVTDKKITGAPHEIFLVLDATTGQNAVSQTRLFDEAVDVTGLVLTKLDGTAKGGIVVNVCHEFNIPVRFIGIGEKMDDLRVFVPQEFVDALFSDASQEQ